MRTATEASAAKARLASAAGRKPGSKGGGSSGVRSMNSSAFTRAIEPSTLPGCKNPLRQLACKRKYICEAVRALVQGLVAPGTFVKVPLNIGADWRENAVLFQVNITAPGAC